MSKRKPAKFAKLKIVARAGTIFARHKMQVWFNVRQSIVIYEREWPGTWPPQVGDTFAVRLPGEGDGDG